MKRQTRTLLLNLATGAAIAATAAVVFLPAAAVAAPATITETVNLRDAPSGSVVGRVSAGTQVDVTECRGSWCFVNKPGPDGWVAAQYLSGVTPRPNVQFGFSIGSDGQPNVQFGIGNNPPPRGGRDRVRRLWTMRTRRSRKSASTRTAAIVVRASATKKANRSAICADGPTAFPRSKILKGLP
jgi:uncharacterized protein YraI